MAYICDVKPRVTDTIVRDGRDVATTRNGTKKLTIAQQYGEYALCTTVCQQEYEYYPRSCNRMQHFETRSFNI
jgi:hypothetical protein